MPPRPGPLAALALALALGAPLARATAPTLPPPDHDHDGLSDALEQALLDRFTPRFRIDAADCALRPARFLADQRTPAVAALDGTIYGQAFPQPTEPRRIELHFYHLWASDCGRDGHALDTEHVSTLLEQQPNSDPADPASWQSRLWYAAAHEDTVCDASQIARAPALDAETHGPVVWISPGKHASFLAQVLCHAGCGADRCLNSVPLAAPAVINLGELHAPMHGALWISSPRWPLAAKMARSDFRPASLASLDRLPPTSVAWVYPGKRPAQGTIAVSATTADALEHSSDATTGALDHSGHNTDAALGVAAGSTVTAVGTAVTGTTHALGRSATKTRRFLHLGSDSKPR